MNGPADLARGWMLKGDSDRGAAERIAGGPGPFDTACFHAQQAAEKYLKALIAFQGAAIPRTHDLEDLHREALRQAPHLRLDPADLAQLTPFAVQLRYSATFWPQADEAREAIRRADGVRAAVVAHLPPAAIP